MVAGDDGRARFPPAATLCISVMFSNDCGLHGRVLNVRVQPLDPIHSEGEGATTFPALNNPASFLSTPEGSLIKRLLTGARNLCRRGRQGFCPCNNNECA